MTHLCAAPCAVAMLPRPPFCIETEEKPQMQTKIILDEKNIPTHWYNIIPDMPGPRAPFINPRTRQPVPPDDLLPFFPLEIIRKGVPPEGWIPIPDEVRDIYRLWR